MKDAASPRPSSNNHDRTRLYDYSPYSYMSTDKYHRELHNRLVNTLSDIYLLPDDEEEDARLQAYVCYPVPSLPFPSPPPLLLVFNLTHD
ncbi:hypothetical protein FRC14_000163 [Serendipita sp. 396]|nr:hypothetical protein FRC14_000163 [Serendipita sp. 396]